MDMVLKNLHLIQQKAIVPLVNGKNIIAQAQSGSGKTGAFCIGSIRKNRYKYK